MGFERTVEAIIQEAIQRGDFENLAGKGKPINLDLYFQAPAETRLVQKLLLDHGFAPREVELLREIHELQRQADATSDPMARSELRRGIAARRLELDNRLEAGRRHRRGG